MSIWRMPSGRRASQTAFITAGNAPTVNGKTLQITTAGGNVMVDKSKVVMTDVVASNGVIHAIDTVMLP